MVFTADERRERHRLAVRRHRARETSSERADRLRKNRERYRQTHATRPVDEVRQPFGEAYRGWLEGEIPRLSPVSSRTKEHVLRQLRLALGPSGLEEATCVVCDCNKLRTSMSMISVGDRDFIQRMRSLLSSTDEHLPAALQAEYDCSSQFEHLKDMLLSKCGVHPAGFLQVCDVCHKSLQKQLLPKFAIKNGFYVGSLPAQLLGATLPERLMTQTVSVVAVTRVMRGGAHRAIRSHCLAFDSTPGPAATLLPRSVRDITCYRVVMAGPFTTEQQARVRQMHLIRRQVVEDLLAFYRAHNVLYADVIIDCSNVDPESEAEFLICEEPGAVFEAETIDAECDRVGSVATLGVADDETDVVEHRVVFVPDDREVSTQGPVPAQVRVDQMSTQQNSQPQFLVRHSTRFASKDDNLFAREFPHLFPFGRGHPRESRRIAVSLDACIKHYCQLSSRRFAEDELFTVVSFDHLTLQRMYTQVALKCQRDPDRFERYSDISEESLVEALRAKELHRQGRTAKRHDGGLCSANGFLKTVELSSGVIWGSDAERAQCRRRAFAYQARFGQPALFVTLTPNVADSFVMAHYTGISSVDALFDASLAKLPRRSALHSAGLRNDIASARLFMHNMNAFVEHVLGVPPAQMKTGQAFDGLFGKVTAYFGMVETQGGGTLHAHFLVWLEKAPPNSGAFQRAVEALGDQYYHDVAAFTDSVVTTSLPLDVAASSCLFCGHSLADLQELPIPLDAYESPSKARGRTRGEPVLVRCAGCGTEMSSQHVLRRVLLANRPASWPPALRDYTSQELDDAVQMEVQCRGTVGAAKAAVFRRNMILSTREDVDDVYGDYLRTLNHAPFRHEQRQDDAFQNDKVVQAVMTLPPSIDDERWPQKAVAFALSTLVFMLNLHWWSHVGSCFKSSRASQPGQCRYGFPRPRASSTTCTNAGVKLARRTPFEYVNGFNETMMLAFKSNHDVQVLVGGMEALLRIFYATKYVTKMQNLVDSITAVALAAFKHRELRELEDQSQQVDRSAVGRRRVASLVFALTNRREIAGPLAALYLLRGSCAYMSASCTSLPLNDALRELIENSTHQCSLVELRDGETEVTFRAASFLDDYLFRPLSLRLICLYEFVMTCFRRKKSASAASRESFLAGHPLHSTHCIGHHQSKVVPVITGVHIPYLDSETPRDLVVKRAKCALVLFKPFRNVLDLVSDPTSEDAWIEAYFQWESTRSSFVCEIMANMDDYYHAAMLAKEERESGNPELHGDADSDDVVGTRNDLDAVTDSILSDSEVPIGGRADNFYSSAFDDDDADMSGDDPSLPVFPTNTSESLLSSILHEALLTASAERTAQLSNDLRRKERALDMPIDEIQQWVNNPSTDEAEPLRNGPTGEDQPTQVIELIQSALDSDRAWTSPNHQQQQQCTDEPPRPYASMGEVSKAFTLNMRQHIAFYLIASALLRRFLSQQLGAINSTGGYRGTDYEARLRADQLLMFLGGAGGTGKSRVIDAVDAFCASWHHNNSIVKAALTGKAATLIGGRTLASFLVRLENAIKGKKFAPLDLLVIDEISMMSKNDWVQLDNLLRHYKQVQSVPFGGIHVVLVGDFLQMPPVKSDPIYIDPTEKAKKTTVDVVGFELWRIFTCVVILEESVRFRNDPAWGEGCRNARFGRWTPDFVGMINARVVQGEGEQVLDQILSSSVFVTPENATRLAINNAFIKATSAMLPTDVYPIRIVANFKGALNGLSQSDLCYVLSLPDNRFGRMAPYLDVVDGMPIQITQNVATAKGIANGTLGRLEYVHFPVGTRFRLVRDGATATVVQLPNHSPDYALVRVPRPQASAIRPGVDPELFPIFYATEAYTKKTIKLSPAPDGQPRSVTVRPQQFPFVCAVGSTVYKVQGETLQSMVVMDWKSMQGAVNKPQQTYLLVSRVTTRNGLIALAPLTAKLAAWSKPPTHALQEEERLRQLSDATLAGFHLPVATNVANRVLEELHHQDLLGTPRN